MNNSANQVSRIYRPAVASPAGQGAGGETVPEFVAYFYEFVRDDAAMVRLLDRALKERYGLGGTHD
jgi:hypothetical protein